jgi:hypothetical protein
MPSRSLARSLAMIASLACAGACGSSPLSLDFPAGNRGGGGGGGGGTATATYLGAIGDSLRYGALSFTVTSSNVVNGTLTFVGGPIVPVAGVVDTAGRISATGSNYTIAGHPSSGTISGSYTGPGGGGFLVAASDSLTGMAHTTYCGTYTSTNGNGWIAILILSSGSTRGFVVQTSGTAASSAFSGTVLNGTALTAMTNIGVTITGSVSADLQTVTGSYAPPVAGATSTGTETGQFTATAGGC